MLSRTFFKRAGERALKSAAQALILLWGADGLNVLTVDWPTAGGLAGGAAILSALTSVASAGAGDADSPSLTK